MELILSLKSEIVQYFIDKLTLAYLEIFDKFKI